MSIAVLRGYYDDSVLNNMTNDDGCVLFLCFVTRKVLVQSEWRTWSG